MERKVPENLRCCICGGETTTSPDYVEVEITDPESEGSGRHVLGAHLRCLNSLLARSFAVPREALIYEGNTVRVWVAHDDKTIELREIKTGLANGTVIQAVEGLRAGERVVTLGTLEAGDGGVVYHGHLDLE